MKLNRRGKSLLPESSASSDIAFLLIIYFIVIAGFNINKGFLVNLPQKNSTRLILKEDLIRFELDERGALRYQGAEVSRARAEEEIRALIAGRPDRALVLSVAPLAPWQEVVSFVELAQRLNVEAFSFSMMPARDAGGGA
ncbi:MAG: biopolymer transporter ExbD [Spirochaetaceae bacterium]|jgi:biopolymer transport protein ExbD|nr:biopolymer transporter ExbD [Spirochaetaceae bacterium]